MEALDRQRVRLNMYLVCIKIPKFSLLWQQGVNLGEG